jgi:hypothetical protein
MTVISFKHLSQSKEHGSSFLKTGTWHRVCGDETKTDVWVEDCSIASIIVQLTAQSLGLGTCWDPDKKPILFKRVHIRRIYSETSIFRKTFV